MAHYEQSTQTGGIPKKTCMVYTLQKVVLVGQTRAVNLSHLFVLTLKISLPMMNETCIRNTYSHA
jgi:hypothetical protein